jgi:CDP-4-dehydro-6-deoxyglucose reductase
VLSAAKPDDHWAGRTGYVHEAVANDIPNLAAYDVYMAGPPAMIVAARKQFIQQGLPSEQLFSDSFEYSQDD